MIGANARRRGSSWCRLMAGLLAAAWSATGCQSAGPNEPVTRIPVVEALDDNTFSPGNLVVNVGDTVLFRNGRGLHNVVDTNSSLRCANGCDGQGGDGNPSADAWSFSLVMNTVGVFSYLCEVHIAEGMTGTIDVR